MQRSSRAAHRCLPQQHERPSITQNRTAVREPQKIERLRLWSPCCRTVLPGRASKADELRLVLVERQSKAIQPRVQLTQERLRIVFSLKAQYRVIGVPYDDNIARGLPLAPLVDPEIHTIVEIDIRQQRRNYCALCEVNDYAK